jgi:hypothetical protein
LALTLKKLSHNFTKNLQGGAATLAHSSITYIAVATAGFLNSYCMRMGEMSRGVKIYDDEEKEAGISKVAAKKAVV